MIYIYCDVYNYWEVPWPKQLVWYVDSGFSPPGSRADHVHALMVEWKAELTTGYLHGLNKFFCPYYYGFLFFKRVPTFDNYFSYAIEITKLFASILDYPWN